MSYATLEEIRNFLPRFEISASSEPNAEQVEEYADNISSQIDGMLSAKGYSVPVSGAISLGILRSIVLAGTGWWITRTMFPSATDGLVKNLEEEYKRMMAMLDADNIDLPDAVTDTSGESTVSASAFDASVASSMAPFVTRGQVF